MINAGGVPPTTKNQKRRELTGQLVTPAWLSCLNKHERIWKMYAVYIIKSLKSGSFYIGSTQNLVKRLKQHNANRTRSLKNRGPFELVYSEEFDNLTDARKRELQIKSYKGGLAFKKLIKLGAVV